MIVAKLPRGGCDAGACCFPTPLASSLLTFLPAPSPCHEARGPRRRLLAPRANPRNVRSARQEGCATAQELEGCAATESAVSARNHDMAKMTGTAAAPSMVIAVQCNRRSSPQGDEAAKASSGLCGLHNRSTPAHIGPQPILHSSVWRRTHIARGLSQATATPRDSRRTEPSQRRRAGR